MMWLVQSLLEDHWFASYLDALRYLGAASEAPDPASLGAPLAACATTRQEQD
jgi:hypothetical protein